MNTERILALADRVEGYEKFDQQDVDHCVIAVAENMMREENFSAQGSWDQKVAQFLGITPSEAFDILIADYANIGLKIGDFKNRMRDVTRDIAASAMRELAERG